jgi:hypothetical protein
MEEKGRRLLISHDYLLQEAAMIQKILGGVI